MRGDIEFSVGEKNTICRLETLWLGLRIYRGLLLNLFKIRAPLFCGHKLTYNCNLQCGMCPFWKRFSKDLSTESEKAILRQIFDSGACGIAFEGGEPLLRNDLVEILAFSRSLPLHTSLVTNGTLLESRIDEIAPYINGALYVSLDGLEKTHDTIRGVSGCFRKAVKGIIAAREKVALTINTTIMAENIHEIEDLVKLAKELDVKISVALAYEYCNSKAYAPASHEIRETAGKLVEMKKKGYPLVNSISYFKVIAKEKKWTCKPWAVVNVSPEGNLVLPCYVRNDYTTSVSVFETDIKTAISGFDWEETQNCQNCSLHCYVEPSLVLSWDFRTYLNWGFKLRV
ncbi:MAG: PTO1314 family radical SAM protein [Candidatus Bathyarchaeota archaeon]|nr:PTO1314 family radical SAM protein [Candidatus Bathyarchaeum tardum]WGM89914.1 MAG: PTO1314 family radical SAM protein [Candidatus Bathyarchaeum tardum]